jgi:hypothetical protein
VPGRNSGFVCALDPSLREKAHENGHSRGNRSDRSRSSVARIQGFSVTTQKKFVDVGSIHATKDEKHRIPLPPVLGGCLLVGGVVLLVSGSRNTAR